MEILDLRHLRSRDLEPLLEEETELWQRDLRWDYSASAALIKRYIDARSLPGYAAVEGGRTVGYGFYVYENDKGVVGDVFASDLSGAEETERQLLVHVVETLQGMPGIRRIEAQLMNLRHPLGCDFFSRESLQSFRRRFMLLSLRDAPSLQPQSFDGVEIQAWDGCWVSEAAQLITRAYDGHIDSSISDQYRSRTGVTRFLENIVHYPGCGDFDPECSFLAFRKDSSVVCGVALCSVVGDRVSHITQVCVEPELQGTGLGRMLIGHIVGRLRERGFAAVTLTVTDSNTRAVRLYEQMQFHTLKEFSAFVWDAPEEKSIVTGRG